MFTRAAFRPDSSSTLRGACLQSRGELATNLSRKRVPLTDAETLEYRIIEYVSTHKGRTLPASLGDHHAPQRGTHVAHGPTQLSQTCYVRVAKDGRVAAAFSRCRRPAAVAGSGARVSVEKGSVSEPALENGKPVESTTPINLAPPGPPVSVGQPCRLAGRGVAQLLIPLKTMKTSRLPSYRAAQIGAYFGAGSAEPRKYLCGPDRACR